MKKGGHCIHELLDGLEEMVMSDLTSQVLPETLDRIELGGIRRQADEFGLLLMLKQPGLHGFGKVDAVNIDD